MRNIHSKNTQFSSVSSHFYVYILVRHICSLPNGAMGRGQASCSGIGRMAQYSAGSRSVLVSFRSYAASKNEFEVKLLKMTAIAIIMILTLVRDDCTICGFGVDSLTL